MKEEKKKKWKLKEVKNSFKYAFDGFAFALKTERNMKIHITIMILVVLMGIALKNTLTEWIICIILFSIVIAGELFNTAIENIVDIVMPYKNEKAKIAKDISASAVLVLAVGAAIVGMIIFIPKIAMIINIHFKK